MLRILSDLHFRDASSRLRRLEDLQPLLDGVTELWLNGDTCDNQTGLTAAESAEIRAFFIARVPHVTFLTGNHDPDFSAIHHRQAAHGRLFATHGDVFFDDIVPWSRVRTTLVQRVQDARRAHPSWNFETLDDRLNLMRAACIGFARECDPERRDVLHRLRRAATELLPPKQFSAIVRTWWTFPDLIVARHPDWFPAVQVVVTGHVHFPRVWRRGALTIVNTGAYSGPLGAYAVDLESDHVTVRRVQQRHHRWFPGPVVAEIPLAARSPIPLTTGL